MRRVSRSSGSRGRTLPHIRGQIDHHAVVTTSTTKFQTLTFISITSPTRKSIFQLSDQEGRRLAMLYCMSKSPPVVRGTFIRPTGNVSPIGGIAIIKIDAMVWIRLIHDQRGAYIRSGRQLCWELRRCTWSSEQCSRIPFYRSTNYHRQAVWHAIFGYPSD